MVIAQVGNRAFVAARALVHANALPMAQQRIVKVVDRARIIGQQGLKQIMGRICRHFLPDEAQANAHSPYMRIYRQDGLLTAKEQDAGPRFGTNAL